ncbi:hypothetical protein V1477_013627 [Vespula maculifrons]|uniref:Uncharacterized protein n=2 Tax=Vespula maculifrons TaxID=7453 RepID=A0ABD2BQN4_VESMC
MSTRRNSKQDCTSNCQSQPMTPLCCQGMSDIIMFLHQLFFITCGECVLRDLRCALVEIQSKNGPVTVKVSHSSNVVVVSEGMSDIIMFLHQLFFITCGEYVLRDL